MAQKRPTILQIIPELDTGGAELSAVEIADAIVRAGGRALVLSEGGRLAPRIAAAGGEFVPFPAATKNPIRLLWNARVIRRMIEREGVDLVHARSRAPAWSAMIAARRAGKPFVTTYHGAYNEKTSLKRAYNAVMAKGDVVIANSRYTKQLIEQRYGTEPGKIRVIYRGVDGTKFDPAAISAERKAALRAQWKAAPDTRIVLQLARLTAWKGQSTVIEAARLLETEGRLGPTLIVLAGDAQGRDAYREKLETEIRDAGLTGKVILPGHVEDVPAALAIAHLAVVASTEPEAFGRVATEAQVMGCPVIATDLGAPPETIAAPPYAAPQDATGWLVPPGNAVKLAEAMAEALNLVPEARKALGTRARARVLGNYSLDTMRLETLGVYDKLLGTRLQASYPRIS
ncbi:glycosyltransferase family 4 protein [Hyphomicrobium sp. LHD-15]|uniref:glycosyltransferase family 4 protein n=1 Tax=Hyphomicrobium sp. LHD-15 TaxID=3072142 RepID=UPI00280CBB14|nr:glycosyltransferase family 4 protein [Hyphomicrobium sp. LHD-15]MDQ8698809.1 glycosyltransferase family 4 protein [Hyphomicrobium sp. LHD-15]